MGREVPTGGQWYLEDKAQEGALPSFYAYLPHTMLMPVQMLPTYTMQRKTIFISDAYDG